MDQFAFSGFSASNMLACVVDGTDIRSRWGLSSSWLTSASGLECIFQRPAGEEADRIRSAAAAVDGHAVGAAGGDRRK